MCLQGDIPKELTATSDKREEVGATTTDEQKRGEISRGRATSLASYKLVHPNLVFSSRADVKRTSTLATLKSSDQPTKMETGKCFAPTMISAAFIGSSLCFFREMLRVSLAGIGKAWALVIRRDSACHETHDACCTPFHLGSACSYLFLDSQSWDDASYSSPCLVDLLTES